MKIVVLGLNHHSAPVEVRERVAVPVGERGPLCASMVDAGAAEAVVLSTCNRTEILMLADDANAACSAAREALASRIGDGGEPIADSLFVEAREGDAVRHLFEVVTSLDSLVVGEPHIIGQVRDDFERARKAGTVGKALGRLFLRAFELAKAARKETSIGESPVSVSSIALDLAARVFGTMEGRRVLVLGAGEMGRQTAVLAGHRGVEKITVCSRTIERARCLAERVGGDVRPMEEWTDAALGVDLIITSTSAKTPIVDREQMTRIMQERKNRPLFLVDIAVPRDVDPAVDSLYNLYRYDLDDLTEVARENEARRKGAVPEVQRLIDAAITRFEEWQRELKVVPTIVGLREHVEEIRKGELEAHLRKMRELDERERNIVEALTQAIVNKVLHTPTVRLKEATSSGADSRHAGSMRYLFGLDERDSAPPPEAQEEPGEDDEA